MEGQKVKEDEKREMRQESRNCRKKKKKKKVKSFGKKVAAGELFKLWTSCTTGDEGKRGNLLEEKRFRRDTFRICRELDPNALSFSHFVYLVFSRRESGGGSASCLYSFPLLSPLFTVTPLCSLSLLPRRFLLVSDNRC